MSQDPSSAVDKDDAIDSNERRMQDDLTAPMSDNDNELHGYDDVSISEGHNTGGEISSLEKLENGGFDMDDEVIPIHSEDVGASLPSAEEFRSSEFVFGKDKSSGKIDTGDHDSAKLSRKMYWKILVAAVIVFILGMSLIVAQKNKDAHASAAADTNQANSSLKKNSGGLDDKDSSNDATYGDGNETSVIVDDMNQIIAYFSSTYGISNFEDPSSAQYKAALWFAARNQPTLMIPGSSNGTSELDSPVYKYRYLARYIMAVVYYSMNGEDWSNGLSFLSPSTDICTWLYQVVSILGEVSFEGIVCDNSGFPLALMLPDLNITGTIPSELGLLTSLKVVDFGRNNITGSIPTELCDIASLEVFSSIYNLIEGSIPDCIGNLKNLTHLFLSGNSLDGSIPSSVGSLSMLTDLYVDENMLTGNPLSIWEKLTNLEHLQAFSNEFTGDIRTLFSPTTHRNLSILDLSSNNFTSPYGFPKHLLNMPSLLVIDLSQNQLSGSIPPITAENDVLLHLSLYKNNINGAIPSGIEHLTNCSHLDVSINQLTGSMPTEIGLMTTLTYLFLSDNPSFQAGSVPDSYAQLNLSELSLRNTNRIGPLPSFINEFTDLQLLDLSKNEFTGSVPASWNSLPSIQYLLLNDNPGINGSIANVLKNMTSFRAGFIDGTAIVSNLTGLCPSLKKPDLFGETKILYADCGGHKPTVTCACCKCCDVKKEAGCSRPMLSNLDLIWDTYYKRSFYRFTNKTFYYDSDISLVTP